MLKFVLVVALFAGLVYALMWALEQRRGSKPAKPAEKTRAGTRQVAPDDDDDFLRELGRKRRPKDHPDP